MNVAPCPFCGGQADEGRGECGELVSLYSVHCPECGAGGPCGSSPSEAIARWNTRRENVGDGLFIERRPDLEA